MSASNNSADQDPMADAKEKMRAALERKSAGSHPTDDQARNTGSVHGSEVIGDPKRTFKPRKTG
ncbi:MAG TPA: DUF5302 domain-containing protein [Beutenbergiaceae bacterium]|nr:DUF5302 domain-containing protein [Beutenbergiaceae bacterium]